MLVVSVPTASLDVGCLVHGTRFSPTHALDKRVSDGATRLAVGPRPSTLTNMFLFRRVQEVFAGDCHLEHKVSIDNARFAYYRKDISVGQRKPHMVIRDVSGHPSAALLWSFFYIFTDLIVRVLPVNSFAASSVASRMPHMASPRFLKLYSYQLSFFFTSVTSRVLVLMTTAFRADVMFRSSLPEM